MNEIIKKAEAHGRKLRLKVMSLALPEIRKKGWGTIPRKRKQIFKGVTIESILQEIKEE